MTPAPRNPSTGNRPGGVGSGAVSLRPALLLTLVLACAAGVVAGLVSGAPGLVGVLIGAAMVVGFFGTGALVLGVVARAAPAASLLVALLTYTLQVVLVAVVFVALRRAGVLGDSVDPRWLAGTVVAGTFCWLAGQLLATVRARVPAYDVILPGERAEGSRDGSAEGGGGVSGGRQAGAR